MAGTGPITSSIGDFSGAVSSLFAGFAAQKKSEMYKVEADADLLKGKGFALEGESYGLAQGLALKNKEYAGISTTIQEAQAGRAITQSLGATRAAVAGSGLRESGSALDVLADSARQGELQKQVLGFQGAITEAGYQEQADVYGKMVDASKVAVEGTQLASKEHLMAADAEETAAKGDFITGGIKAAAGVAALLAAPATGGASLALGSLFIPGNWGEQG